MVFNYPQAHVHRDKKPEQLTETKQPEHDAGDPLFGLSVYGPWVYNEKL